MHMHTCPLNQFVDRTSPQPNDAASNVALTTSTQSLPGRPFEHQGGGVWQNVVVEGKRKTQENNTNVQRTGLPPPPRSSPPTSTARSNDSASASRDDDDLGLGRGLVLGGRWEVGGSRYETPARPRSTTPFALFAFKDSRIHGFKDRKPMKGCVDTANSQHSLICLPLLPIILQRPKPLASRMFTRSYDHMSQRSSFFLEMTWWDWPSAGPCIYVLAGLRPQVGPTHHPYPYPSTPTPARISPHRDPPSRPLPLASKVQSYQSPARALALT